jgi:hypothetical protein
MRKIGFLVAVLLAAPALAGFTATDPGPLASDHAFGTAGNGFFTFDYTGAAFPVGSIIFEGDLTSGGVGSYLSEARLALTNPTGIDGFIQPATGTTWTGTQHIGPITITGGHTLWGDLSVGTWRFEFFESYDDSGVDATWTNVSFIFQDWTPPPLPPIVADLGVIGDMGPDPDRIATGTLAAQEIQWYKFTIAQEALNPGTYLDIDTETSVLAPNNDTEIALYRPDGSLVATDDDDGSGLLSQLTFGDVGPRPAYGTSLAYNGRDGALPAGDYYLAIGGYNSTFGADFAATSASTNIGPYAIRFGTNLIPEPATLVLLALAGLMLRRR